MTSWRWQRTRWAGVIEHLADPISRTFSTFQDGSMGNLTAHLTSREHD